MNAFSRLPSSDSGSGPETSEEPPTRSLGLMVTHACIALTCAARATCAQAPCAYTKRRKAQNFLKVRYACGDHEPDHRQFPLLLKLVIVAAPMSCGVSIHHACAHATAQCGKAYLGKHKKEAQTPTRRHYAMLPNTPWALDELPQAVETFNSARAHVGFEKGRQSASILRTFTATANLLP